MRMENLVASLPLEMVTFVLVSQLLLGLDNIKAGENVENL